MNVTPVSDPPAAGNDVATTPEDTPVFIDVLANDTDADVGDVLTISAVNGTPVTVGGPAVAIVGPNGTPQGSVTLVIEGGKQQLLFDPGPGLQRPGQFQLHRQRRPDSGQRPGCGHGDTGQRSA